MSSETLEMKRIHSGWVGVGLMALAYAALYLLNLTLPLNTGSYTMRIWDWTQAALTLTAVAVVFLRRRDVRLMDLLPGVALGAVSMWSQWAHSLSPWDSLFEGLAVSVCFVGGRMLARATTSPNIRAFQPPLARIGRAILIGIVAAIPLAFINNLYFYLTTGAVQMQGIFASALAALSPAIHEETIYRYFVLALCFYWLRNAPLTRWGITAAVTLAVVPHSMNHLPDLFLANPVMGIVMLIATSLLFGLPMALLQLWKGLEAAIAFHWLIDFARFLFGF